MLSATEIEKIISPLLEGENVVLCGTSVSGFRKRPLIKVYIDKKVDFITINECARINRLLEDLFSISDGIPVEYALEISSPGIDYPMSEIWQFSKNIGRSIRFEEPGTINEENPSYLTGEIIHVSDDSLIQIQTERGDENFSLLDLTGAKIIIEKPKRNKVKRKRHEKRRS